jgi:hypothetical protein
MDRQPDDLGDRTRPREWAGGKPPDYDAVMREARRMQAEVMAEMAGAVWRGLRRLARRIFAPAAARGNGVLARRARS